MVRCGIKNDGMLKGRDVLHGEGGKYGKDLTRRTKELVVEEISGLNSGAGLGRTTNTFGFHSGGIILNRGLLLQNL